MATAPTQNSAPNGNGNGALTVKPVLVKKLEVALPRMLKMLPDTYANPASQERFCQIVLSIARDPNMLECQPLTVLAGIMACARLGLVPDATLGHIYLIPYKKKATVVLGYKGMVELARRSGLVTGVWGDAVYQEDRFHWRKGLDPILEHEPYWMLDRPFAAPPGSKWQGIKAAYCVAQLKDGTKLPHAVGLDRILKSRSLAYGTDKPSSPWHIDSPSFPAMCIKTAVRDASSFWPQDPMLAKAIDLEQRQERGEAIWSMPDDAIREGLSSVQRETGDEEPPFDAVFDANGPADEAPPEMPEGTNGFGAFRR